MLEYKQRRSPVEMADCPLEKQAACCLHGLARIRHCAGLQAGAEPEQYTGIALVRALPSTMVTFAGEMESQAPAKLCLLRM